MKTKKLFLFLFVSLFFVFNFVSCEIDTSLKVEYCEFAASSLDVSKWEFDGGNSKESEVFFPWNEESQEGIFSKVTNQNMELGKLSVTSDYKIEYFNEGRMLYNEFQEYTRFSPYPIFNLDGSEKKFLYIRCFFKVGDSNVFISDRSGFGISFFPTNDFNLTKGIISENDPYIGVTLSSVNYTYLARSFHGADYRTTPVWLNNLENSFNDIVYSDTKPYAIYKSFDLSLYPSSLLALSSWWFLRSSGAIQPLHSALPGFYFYLNNSDVDLKKYLVPIDINWSKNSSQGDNYSSVLYPRSSARSYGSSEFNLNRSSIYFISSALYNPYNFDLNFSSYYSFSYNGWFAYTGLTLEYPKQYFTEKKEFILPAREIINIDSFYNPQEHLNENLVSPGLTAYFYVDSQIKKLGFYQTRSIFQDSFPYISFGTIGPRVVLEDKDGDEKYENYFRLNVDLSLEKNLFRGKLNDSDYIFQVEIYSADENVALNKVFLKENLFFNETYSVPEGFFSDRNFLSVNDLGNIYGLYFDIPISSSWGPGKYYPKISAILNSSKEPYPHLEGKMISRDTSVVYFNAGDIQYAISDQFNLFPGRDEEIKKITISNPSTLSINCVSFSVEKYSSSINNFTINGVPSGGICIDPLQNHVFSLNVSAKQGYLFNDNHEERFILRTTSTLSNLDAPSFKEYKVKFSKTIPCEIDSILWDKVSIPAPQKVNFSLTFKGGDCFDKEISFDIKKCVDEFCSSYSPSSSISPTHINGNPVSFSWDSMVVNQRSLSEKFKVIAKFLGKNYTSSNSLNVTNPNPLILKSARIF